MWWSGYIGMGLILAINTGCAHQAKQNKEDVYVLYRKKLNALNKFF